MDIRIEILLRKIFLCPVFTVLFLIWIVNDLSYLLSEAPCDLARTQIT